MIDVLEDSVPVPIKKKSGDTQDDVKEKVEGVADELVEEVEAGSTPTGPKKKKKKKKKSSTTPSLYQIDELDNSIYRCVGNWPSSTTSRQNFPPTVPIHEAFAGGPYPMGEIQEYSGNNSFRITDEEKRESEKVQESDYQNIRRAAECHRQVWFYLPSFLSPVFFHLYHIFISRLLSFCSLMTGS